MKKLFTCLALAALSAGSALNAAVSLTNGASVSLNGILADAENAPEKIVMEYSGNSLYATGNFDTAFGDMSPLTTSDAFIVKYNKGLAEEWKVQLMGSVTVTAMLADGDGGIYVAGTYADEVEVGSTDGNTKTITGYEEYGEPVETKSASFVAHYNGAGVLQGVGTIIPEQDQRINDYVAENPDGVFPLLDTYCHITKLVEVDGKILAAADLCGVIKNGSESAVSGSLFDTGLITTTVAGVVIEFDENLNISSFPLIVSGRYFEEGVTIDESVTSFTITSAGTQLYAAFNSHGLMSIDAYDNVEQIGTANNSDYGYTVVAIDTQAKSAKVKDYERVTVEDWTYATYIDNIAVAGENLVISGLFQTACGFDKFITPVSGCDMYVASIKTSDLSINWVAASGFNEGESGSYLEWLTGSGVYGDKAYLYGFNELKSNSTKQAPLFYSFDLVTGGIETIDTEDYIFGMAGNDASIATAHTTVPVSGITFTAYGDFVAGVDNIAADKAQQVSVYPNPVVDELHFSLPCDVQIYSLDGKLVLDAAGVTSVNVADLNGGVYVVKTVTDGETSFCKVLKK